MKTYKFGQHFTCSVCAAPVYDNIVTDQHGDVWCPQCVSAYENALALAKDPPSPLALAAVAAGELPEHAQITGSTHKTESR